MPKCDRNIAARRISSATIYGAHCSAMRVCYDIQTHRDPEQIERLVRTLLRESPGAVVHISHDRRGPVLDERGLQAYGDVVVELADGGYGDYSHVDRHMQAITWVLEHRPDVDWLVNITGQDYPIVRCTRARGVSIATDWGFEGAMRLPSFCRSRTPSRT